MKHLCAVSIIILSVSACADQTLDAAQSSGTSQETTRSATAQSVPTTSVPNSVSGSSMRWSHVTGSEGWQAFVEEAIDLHGDSLRTSTPSDIANWCPAFAGQTPEERKAFWSYLMSSLMKFESNYDTTVSFQESFNDRFGNPVISRGLLQLSKESANGYGCGIGDPKELHDPKTNLQCSVRIMNRWLDRDGAIVRKTAPNKWRGFARYWSPFRSKSKLKTMQQQVADSSYCR